MPRTADIPAPIAASEVRLSRYLSVHRHAGVDADHALLMHQPVAAPAGDIDHFCARHAARDVDVWRISEPAAAGFPRDDRQVRRSRAPHRAEQRAAGVPSRVIARGPDDLPGIASVQLL